MQAHVRVFLVTSFRKAVDSVKADPSTIAILQLVEKLYVTGLVIDRSLDLVSVWHQLSIIDQIENLRRGSCRSPHCLR